MAGNALYDVGLRLRAAELYDMGRGRASIAALLGIPEETVRKWLDIYRSAGIEVLAMMGKKHAAYSFETKLAAVRAVVDEGMTKPEGASPILHSDMGWQYQQAGWCSRLEKAGVVQSMSRKGNCIDNGATEQVFGHMKDELFRGREWLCFEDFKRDLDEYVIHWNTRRRQVKLKGLTPEEFRNQSLCAA